MTYSYAKLGDIATYINGYAFKPKDHGTKGLPIIRIQDLTGSSNDRGYYAGEYPSKIEINNGDVLISWSASLGVYVWNKGKALLNQHIFKVKFDKKDIDKDYFVYAVRFNLTKLKQLTHGATMKHVVKKDFENVLIPYPSLKRQREIAYVLDKIERNLTQKSQELDKLDELIKARFVEMFGDLKFDTSLSFYVNSLVAGKSLAGKQESPNKVLNTGAVSYDYFRNDSKNLPLDYVPLEKNQIQTSDLLISRMNTQELVGAVAYVWEAPKHTYLPDRLWKAKLKDNVNPIFIWQALIYPLSKIQIRRMATGTSGSMKNISKNNFLAVKIPYAKIQKQNEFANFVQQVDKSKVAVQKSLEETQTLFDSLMQKYFG